MGRNCVKRLRDSRLFTLLNRQQESDRVFATPLSLLLSRLSFFPRFNVLHIISIGFVCHAFQPNLALGVLS